jgi:hypothetical protein
MAKTLLKKISGSGFAGLNLLLRRFGYRVERLDQMNFFEPLLYRRLARNPSFFFVQIGANDGISSDPIHGFVTRNRVAGLAVEPLQDIFARLVANYRDYPAVKPVNVALHRTARSLEIHRVDPIKGKQLGDWTQGIGSFRPGHHELSNTPRELMVSETVRCVTRYGGLRLGSHSHDRFPASSAGHHPLRAWVAGWHHDAGQFSRML